MIDEMANHGTRIRRYIERYGLDAVEDFIDACLSLENLIDPHSPFIVRRRPRGRREPRTSERGRGPMPVGTLARQGLHGPLHQPAGRSSRQQRRAASQEQAEERKRFPPQPERDVLLFLLEHAPLERWQRDILAIIREEAYYFAPQGQTKIMNEGWATYWHSKIMTERLLDGLGGHRLRRPPLRHGRARSPGGSTPTSSGSSSSATSRSAGTRATSARSATSATTARRTRALGPEGSGWAARRSSRSGKLYNDVTFIDEFLTAEFCREQKLFHLRLQQADRHATRSTAASSRRSSSSSCSSSPTSASRSSR